MLSYPATIRSLRIGLPLALGAAAAAMVLAVSPAPQAPHDSGSGIQLGRMTNPLFFGIDEQQQPFRLQALTAQQEGEDGNVTLQGLSADLTLETGQKAALEAGTARYNHRNQTIELGGRIRLEDERGYALDVQDVDVDITGQSASTQNGVSGQTPQGAISAEGLDILEAGKKLIFRGASQLQMRGDGEREDREQP